MTSSTWPTVFWWKPTWSSGEPAARSPHEQLKCFCATPGRGTCANSATSFAGPCSSLRMQHFRTDQALGWNHVVEVELQCPPSYFAATLFLVRSSTDRTLHRSQP